MSIIRSVAVLARGRARPRIPLRRLWDEGTPGTKTRPLGPLQHPKPQPVVMYDLVGSQRGVDGTAMSHVQRSPFKWSCRVLANRKQSRALMSRRPAQALE